MGEIDRCIRRAPADHTMSLVIGHNTQLWRLHTLRPTRTSQRRASSALGSRPQIVAFTSILVSARQRKHSQGQ